MAKTLSGKKKVYVPKHTRTIAGKKRVIPPHYRTPKSRKIAT